MRSLDLRLSQLSVKQTTPKFAPIQGLQIPVSEQIMLSDLKKPWESLHPWDWHRSPHWSSYSNNNKILDILTQWYHGKNCCINSCEIMDLRASHKNSGVKFQFYVIFNDFLNFFLFSLSVFIASNSLIWRDSKMECLALQNPISINRCKHFYLKSFLLTSSHDERQATWMLYQYLWDFNDVVII